MVWLRKIVVFDFTTFSNLFSQASGPSPRALVTRGWDRSRRGFRESARVTPRMASDAIGPSLSVITFPLTNDTGDILESTGFTLEFLIKYIIVLVKRISF